MSTETTRTKWLQFEREDKKDRKTPIVYVYNRDGEYLGVIKWYAPWRQFCYIIEHDHYEPMKLVLAQSCLDDIRAYIDRLEEERDYDCALELKRKDEEIERARLR